jgi:hypothetical protein
MEIPYYEIMMGVGGLLLANYGAKIGRLYPLMKRLLQYAEEYSSSRRDGILTQKEKANLYDKQVIIIKEAWAIISGWTPFKNK